MEDSLEVEEVASQLRREKDDLLRASSTTSTLTWNSMGGSAPFGLVSAVSVACDSHSLPPVFINKLSELAEFFLGPVFSSTICVSCA